MYFEIIDKKTQYCNKLFINNSITDDYDLSSLKGTWSYDPILKEEEIEYGSIYAQGKKITECCPDHLKDSWNSLVSRHQAFQNSFVKGKVEVSDTCFYDLVPSSFTKDFFSCKNEITRHVVETYEKPSNYDFLVDLSDLVYSIRSRKLNYRLAGLVGKAADPRALLTLQKLKRTKPYISYNIFGSKTGRLSTYKQSFPILNLGKEYRNILFPHNDVLVELDYNAAEFRTILALSGHEQPSEDIHEFHLRKLKEVMTDDFTRDQVKTRMFKWLYGGSVSLGISTLEEIYDKDRILDKYFTGTEIVNSFGRHIECDRYHALSYLNQSELSDLFLRKAVEIHKFLEGRKSFVCWTIHDSLTIDLSMEDKHLLPQIKQIFETTKHGKFLSRVKVGKNFDQMRETQ